MWMKPPFEHSGCFLWKSFVRRSIPSWHRGHLLQNVSLCKKITGYVPKKFFTGSLATKEFDLCFHSHWSVSRLFGFSGARPTQVGIKRNCFKFRLNTRTEKPAGVPYDSQEWNDTCMVAMLCAWSAGTGDGSEVLKDTGFSSVQSLSHVRLFATHESQHARPPCPAPTPRVHSDSRPSSPGCHPAISSSVVPFSSWPQSLPASGSFPMSQLFAWGGQSTGVSGSASVLPMNTQDWSPLGWTGWISFQSKGLSRVFSNTTVQKHQFFSAQLSL